MGSTRPSIGDGTLTSVQRSRKRGSDGVVTGHLFKIVRERLPCTQRKLAELLNVDLTTIQGWESGRRSLAGLSSAQFMKLRRQLLRQGADAALLVLLDAAMEADSVIAHTLGEEGAADEIQTHPLYGWVFTRTATHMIAWALTGVAPTALPRAPATTPPRRGPTPASPILPASERKRFFDRLRQCAEVAGRAGPEGALLRRQALYLCSHDEAPDTHAWLADMQGRKPAKLTHSVWTPAWSDARSLATSLTRYGDQDMLRAFIERGLGNDSGEIANLNYWAYWLGLDSLPQPDDSFMANRSPRLWDAGVLLRALADRLAPDLACVDLNIHSVWALIASRPCLLTTVPGLSQDLRQRVERLLDSGMVSQQSRRELDAVHYGLRLSYP
ncbi:XRE family transcriptional regulator [Streptomyces sp. NPDC050610]|uniref:helix-turn-helix domain-containing protein n=1 Tax=Streptomyces sp. NPDC050610 TaxID=3157097 RepID=UPI0034464FB4